VPIVFWSFRVMVGLGVLMILTGLTSLVLRVRGRLHDVRIFSRWCVLMGPSGFVALLAGWYVTETGRQPFTVYGVLRTADSVSPIGAPGVASSLLAFVIVYLIVFGMGVWYLLRLMGTDPEAVVAAPLPVETRAAGITPVQATHGNVGDQ
jgi:cytochrome d ubiquinol oxidase subunit I